VIDSWATQLLRIRDGKTRGLRVKGVLLALGKELIRAAKEEGGYPDSDDSDDEDDRTSKASEITSSMRDSAASETTVGVPGSKSQELRKSGKKGAKKPNLLHRQKIDVLTK
jgi:hypothetical protein